MKNQILFLLLLYFLAAGFPVAVQGQIKFEREYRITTQAVPPKALTFIESIFGLRKVKWFAEESQDGKTLEAKTVYNKFNYSLEFDTGGTILDVEKTVPVKSLSQEIQQNICRQLDSLFTKHQIMKTQVHWQGSHAALEQLIKSGQSTQNYTQAYELVVKARKDRSSDYYELFFSDRGQLKKILKIERRSSVNLEF